MADQRLLLLLQSRFEDEELDAGDVRVPSALCLLTSLRLTPAGRSARSSWIGLVSGVCLSQFASPVADSALCQLRSKTRSPQSSLEVVRCMAGRGGMPMSVLRVGMLMPAPRTASALPPLGCSLDCPCETCSFLHTCARLPRPLLGARRHIEVICDSGRFESQPPCGERPRAGAASVAGGGV